MLMFFKGAGHEHTVGKVIKEKQTVDMGEITTLPSELKAAKLLFVPL